MTNSACDCDDKVCPIYPEWASYLAAVFAILFCIVGVIGNFITILALGKSSKLNKNATTAFVMALSASDLIFCAINMPLTANRFIHRTWNLGSEFCKLYPMIFYGNVIVSVLTMVAITINRFVLISFNQFYNVLYSKISVICQLLFVLAVAVGIMLPPLFGIWGELGECPATFSCTILEKDGSSPKKMIFIAGFVIPCIVILISYSCIFYKIRKSRKRMEEFMSQESARIRKRDRDDRRLTSLMLLIFVCFMISFLPLGIANVFVDEGEYPLVHILASILAWMASVINPFLYAFTNRQYKEAYISLFNVMKSTSENEYDTGTLRHQPARQSYSKVPSKDSTVQQ